MKWIALTLFLLAAPAIAAWIRTHPQKAPIVWGLLGFLPFVLGPWHLIVAPYSTPFWPGYVKGWEISLLDAVAWGVIFGTPGRWRPPALLLPFLAYLAAVIIAVPNAKFGNLAFSYVIQLLRVLLVLIAVDRVVVSEQGERAVLTGLIVGLAVQAGYAIWARAGGALQTGGSLGHQNLLGFVSHMVLMPAFAMLLAGRWPRIALVGMLAGITVVLLTVSRATIVVAVLGLSLTFLLSIAVRFTGRKAVLGLLSLVVLSCSYPLAHAAFQQRLESQKMAFFGEDKEREAFERAARAMLDANPMGVGPNHYVLVANSEGYLSRAGVAWRVESRSTNVHNSYLLVAAETGYLGLLTMLALFWYAIWYSFSTAVRFRRQAGAQVLVGLGCGILAIAAHGIYEWMFVVNPTQYIFAISLGLISGIRGRFVGKATGSLSSTRSERMKNKSAGHPQ